MKRALHVVICRGRYGGGAALHFVHVMVYERRRILVSESGVTVPLAMRAVRAAFRRRRAAGMHLGAVDGARGAA